MEIGAIITIAIFVIIFGWIGIYQLIRFLKGSLKITLEKSSYSSKENVIGKVQLKAKKQIESNRLFVALIAERLERDYSSRNSRNSKTWVEFLREERNLEMERNYPQNFSNIYNFEIPIPNMGQTGDILNNPIMKGITMFTGMGRIRWKVIAGLDAKGVDLSAQKGVNINIETQNNNNQIIN